MHKLLGFLENISEFHTLLNGLNAGLDQQAVYGLSGSQKAFLLAALALKAGRPFILVTHSEEQALEWQANLQALLTGHEVLYFPVLEWMPFTVLGRSKEIEAKRLRVLAGLDRPVSVITTIQAIERLFLPRDKWYSMCVEMHMGDTLEPETLQRELLDMGYERVDMIEGPGQFSGRGGIMDIYPLAAEPVRLEFFDDELDSIRSLDPATQRSTNQLDSVTVYPARELPVDRAKREEAWPAIQHQAQKVTARLRKSSPTAVDNLLQLFEELQEKFKAGVYDESFEFFANFFYPQLDTFFAYMSRQTFIVLDEAARLQEYLDFASRERAEEYTALLQAGKAFVDPGQLFLDMTRLLSALTNRQSLLLSALPRQFPGFRPKSMTSFAAKPVQGFAGKTAALAAELQTLKNEGYGVALLAGNREQAGRLSVTLRDYGITAPVLEDRLRQGQIGVLPLNLRGGFQIPLAKLAVFSEYEIAGQQKRTRARPPREKIKAEKLAPFVDLKPGDYVVHANHGIGQYLGLEKLNVADIARDYFVIKYAGEDKLYVPFDQVNLIQKYLGGEGQLPKLYKLGGNEWVKVKSKVKAAVKDMAEDLLKLYAEREKAVGFSFSQDNIWQKEFEDRFPYEETPDQLQCIEEVKVDMLQPKPMDRVVCGDVGYGKTEVAIRAAFKAVMDSKQVAVLVPTTILAQQHYVTFCERFAGYPISVEMMSRFRSPKEQKQVAGGLADGSIDVVIGTHRIVSEDIKFKDLGLLIVDEEQRFGVSHKEKLKQLKQNVDVLTLSATPIPRTLHMAMVNIRDMSVIETPPEDRYPVQTYVAEYSTELVREAIRREMNRGGQIFYVHNRVQDLDKIVLDLSKLVPEAKIISAHGQMREEDLEQVMLDFVERQHDILVCTTIIETGLDLPNVNTLIVSDADRMGLSQLYQLRGRVGRSNRKAFAYFLYRRDKILTEVAEKRLSAIRDFTEFGSGFKIAMRDLELRGAGNLLGAEQHGQMAAVGFDMYCKLLEQAVSELRGEKEEAVIEPVIELACDAYFDAEYIADSSLKMDFYQRLMRVRSAQGLSDLTAELIDRFGNPPEPVANLLDIVGIRLRAIQLGIAAVTQEKGMIRLKFGRDPHLSGDQLMHLAKKIGPSLSFAAAEGFEMRLKLNPRIHRNILKVTRDLLSNTIKIADESLTLV